MSNIKARRIANRKEDGSRRALAKSYAKEHKTSFNIEYAIQQDRNKYEYDNVPLLIKAKRLLRKKKKEVLEKEKQEDLVLDAVDDRKTVSGDSAEDQGDEE